MAKAKSDFANILAHARRSVTAIAMALVASSIAQPVFAEGLQRAGEMHLRDAQERSGPNRYAEIVRQTLASYADLDGAAAKSPTIKVAANGPTLPKAQQRSAKPQPKV